jgi:pimeloyl-ACP methyl ester carboxylesterase
MLLRSFCTTLLSFVFLVLLSCSPNNNAKEDRENYLLLAAIANPATEGFVNSADGTKIFYTKVGTGVPVVVLHGGPGLDHNYLVEPLKATMGSGIQLIFFDQRGTGFSEGSFRQINSSFINKTKFLEDLDAIRTGLNLGEQINILGHSWGGLYAMLYATDAKYRARVKSLALVSSAGAVHTYYGPPATGNTFLNLLVTKAGGGAAFTTLAGFQAPIDPSNANYAPTLKALNAYYGFLFKFYFADYTPSNNQNGTSVNFASLNLNSSTEKTIRNGLSVSSLINASLIIDTASYAGGAVGTSNLDIRTALAGITFPVKLIHGADDVVPPGFIINNGTANANSVETALTGVVETKHLIANCGHFPFIEKPSEFSAAISGFFK